MSSRVPLTLALAVCACALPGNAAAQSFVLPGIESSIQIDVSPAHPEPGQSLYLEARSSAYTLSETTLAWTVDGAPLREGKGETSIRLAAGPIGSETDVVVRVTATDGTMAYGQAVIIPAEVDLLYDADSYVPPFFRGRALPSEGTMVRLEAVPHLFFRGTEVAQKDLTYTWYRNGGRIANVSGRGRYAVSIPAPVLFSTDTVSVEVTSDDGLLSGGASVRIPSADPVLDLYEDNPLFGVMYHRAFPAEGSVPDTQATFTAIPYFADALNLVDKSLQWSWSVNGQSLATDDKRPSELTLDAQNSDGIAQVKLDILNTANYFFRASGAWSITLGTSAGSTLFGRPQ